MKLCLLDASAAINLVGSRIPESIIRALPLKLQVVDRAFEEVLRNPTDGSSDPLGALQRLKLVEVLPSDERIVELAVSLACAPEPDDLDDGESYSIAAAVSRKCAVVLDEKKARRVVASRFPDLEVSDSVQLLREPSVVAAIGRETLAQGLKHALQDARMRVLDEHFEWVLDLVGIEVAKTCPSLRRLLRNKGLP